MAVASRCVRVTSQQQTMTHSPTDLRQAARVALAEPHREQGDAG
jgi:hypothetical protein